MIKELTFNLLTKGLDSETINNNLYQNIELFYNNNDGTLVFINNEKYQYKYSSKHFLDLLCKLNFTSIKSYNAGYKLLFNSSYNNPICLKNLNIIIVGNINNYDTVYINLNRVINTKIIDLKKIELEFISGNKIIINKSKNYLIDQHKKIEKVKRYLLENDY